MPASGRRTGDAENCEKLDESHVATTQQTTCKLNIASYLRKYRKAPLMKRKQGLIAQEEAQASSIIERSLRRVNKFSCSLTLL